MATWYDLKLAVLQKMFSADDRIIADESTLGYLAAMPHCANEGLALLATAGKFITKAVKIAQMDIKNLLSETISDPITEFSDSFTFTADEGGSYYFECTGTGRLDIYINDVKKSTININNKSYEIYRNILDNSLHKPVRFEFHTSSHLGIKNVAIYRESFETANDIPAYTQKVKYDLKALAPDFYQIDPQGIFYEGERQIYLQTSDFYQEGTHTLVLDRDMIGSFTIYYRAYPVEITANTDDTYELPIDPEVYALLPLYMASQLYKDDDNAIATSYRNEFEVGFERLVNSANLSSYEEWTSESGWV